MAGMANIPCGGCGHPWEDHEDIEYGPTTCKVEGCDCCSGPARRDDLVDAIKNARSAVHEFMFKLRNNTDMSMENIDGKLQAILKSIDDDLDICRR